MSILKQPTKRHLKRVSGLFIAVLIVATIVPQILSVRPTSADDGGYPWITATTLNQSLYDWGYSPCPSNASGCMGVPYPYNPFTDGKNYGMEDPYTMEFRNCTSYAAWKTNQYFSQSFSGWGNAASWPSHAPTGSVHSPSSYTPVVGDLAQWGTEVANGAGHVAFVYAVDPTTHIASLDEYNAAGTGNFTGLNTSPRTTASTSAGTPDNYIHLGTVSTAAPAPNDFEGDHHTDLMFLHKLSDNASANLYAFYQANGFASPGLIERFDNSVGWNWNQMKVATGDANGDGKSDLFMLHQLADGGFNFYVFNASSFTIGSPTANFPASSGWSWATTKLLTGDFDGDGGADLMLLTQTGDGGADIFLYTAASGFTSPGYVRNFPGTAGWSWNLMKVATGDVNNDGIADVLMLHRLSDGGANFYVLYGGGNNFAPGSPVRNFPGASGWSWDKMKMLAGDFDGDHHADLLMLHELADNASANLYVFRQVSGFTDTSPVRSFQAASGWNWNLMKISAGDVNGDGYSDLCMLHKLTDGGANFYAFYGSSFADVSPSAYFPGSSGWAWDSMLAPLYVQ